MLKKTMEMHKKPDEVMGNARQCGDTKNESAPEHRTTWGWLLFILRMLIPCIKQASESDRMDFQKP